LDLCRAAARRERDAAIALERWSVFQRACEQQRGEREQRVRRRAFERARDQALIALALSAEPVRVVGAGGLPSGLAAGTGIAGSSLRRARRGASKARAAGRQDRGISDS
jgi:hypothetical protein